MGCVSAVRLISSQSSTAPARPRMFTGSSKCRPFITDGIESPSSPRTSSSVMYRLRLGAFALDLGPGTLVVFLAMATFGIAVLCSKLLSLLAERVLPKLPLLDRLIPHLSDFHASSN